MQCCQIAIVRAALFSLVVVSAAPVAAIARTETEIVCQTTSATNELRSDVVKVLSLNVSHGRNKALNQLLVSKERVRQNLHDISLLFRQANVDLAALQEADAASRWSGNFDHVAYIAEQSGLPCRVHGLHSQTWISSYGTALLGKNRPADAQSIRFTRSWPSKQKGFVTATFEWTFDGQRMPITFVSVHFDFLSTSVRARQVDELVGHLSQTEGPLVLMGDFNSQWNDKSSHIQTLTEKLHLRAFAPHRNGLGTYKSASGKRLDWILISHDLKFRDYKTLPDVVSDHYAVYAEIAYRGRQK